MGPAYEISSTKRRHLVTHDISSGRLDQLDPPNCLVANDLWSCASIGTPLA